MGLHRKRKSSKSSSVSRGFLRFLLKMAQIFGENQGLTRSKGSRGGAEVEAAEPPGLMPLGAPLGRPQPPDR
jgi:hypothetical protein